MICTLPFNVYGPGDHFEFKRSHAVSTLVRRLVEARRSKVPIVILLGTGSARRELLHVDDLADACLFLMKNYSLPDIINVGTGEDVAIRDLSETIAEISGHTGKLDWDLTRSDGMPRKLLDVSRLRAGLAASE